MKKHTFLVPKPNQSNFKFKIEKREPSFYWLEPFHTCWRDSEFKELRGLTFITTDGTFVVLYDNLSFQSIVLRILHSTVIHLNIYALTSPSLPIRS